MKFICNLCGEPNSCDRSEFTREAHNCAVCRSSVRTRSIVHALSMELFGLSLVLPDFPQVRSLRGVGTSDWIGYADRLAQKFDYRNTFFESAPKLDLAHPPEAECGTYDFLISSEVFEHVLPPAANAFNGSARLLKPNGVLVLTVPYSLEPSSLEHYPDLHEFGLAHVGKDVVLVNRTKSGEMQVFENVVFHLAERGNALELRELTECDVRRHLAEAGFAHVQIQTEDYPPFGIFHSETWSLPIIARKMPHAFSLDSTRELIEQWRQVKQQLNDAGRLQNSRWMRLGSKLGLVR